MGKFQESLDAYLKAREYHWHYGDEKNKLIADWSVGHAYRMLGDLEQAGKWLRPVLAWCERISEIEFVGWTYKELAEIEIIKENYELAVDYLLKAKKSLEESSMPDWDPEGYKKLVDQIKDTRKKVTE
jgi:tetratricopeptide (TPR) repeat protein